MQECFFFFFLKFPITLGGFTFTWSHLYILPKNFLIRYSFIKSGIQESCTVFAQNESSSHYLQCLFVFLFPFACQKLLTLQFQRKYVISLKPSSVNFYYYFYITAPSLLIICALRCVFALCPELSNQPKTNNVNPLQKH